MLVIIDPVKSPLHKKLLDDKVYHRHFTKFLDEADFILNRGKTWWIPITDSSFQSYRLQFQLSLDGKTLSLVDIELDSY